MIPQKWTVFTSWVFLFQRQLLGTDEEFQSGLEQSLLENFLRLIRKRSEWLLKAEDPMQWPFWQLRRVIPIEHSMKNCEDGPNALSRTIGCKLLGESRLDLMEPRQRTQWPQRGSGEARNEDYAMQKRNWLQWLMNVDSADGSASQRIAWTRNITSLLQWSSCSSIDI